MLCIVAILVTEKTRIHYFHRFPTHITPQSVTQASVRAFNNHSHLIFLENFHIKTHAIRHQIE
jgi:hypothetical protein